MRLVRFAALLSAIALPSCPAWGQAVGGDGYYPDPNPFTVQRGVSEVWAKRFLDPESARFEFGQLRKVVCKTGFLGRGAPAYDWALEFTVNAKNAYGAYTGAEAWTARVNSKGEVSAVPGHIGQPGLSYCRWAE